MLNTDRATKLNRTLIEDVNYPPHPPRKPSPRYLKSHHQMIVVEDRPCLVCGVRNSTLKDPKQNPYGATAIETHHHYIEDSLANAVDPAKFNAKLLPTLLKRTGDTAKYGHPFTEDEMHDWIHGDTQNLWPLCSAHHRGLKIGVHSITGPIWGVQDLLIDGYDLTNFVPTTPHEGAQLENLPGTTGKISSTTEHAPNQCPEPLP